MSSFAFKTLFADRGKLLIGLVIGSSYAQVVASAVWTALGPPRLLARLIAGLVAFGVATLSMFVCALRDAGDDSIAFVIAGAMFVQWLLYQAPLWMVRRRGWRLAWPGAPPGESSAGELQFGVRQLMIWTAIVAAFLAAARLLVGDKLRDVDRMEFRQEAAVFFIASLLNSLLVFPIVWGCFVRRRLWLWLLISALWCALMTPLELLLVKYAASGGRINDLEIFVLMNVAQSLAVAGILLAARLAGFRLTRESAFR